METTRTESLLARTNGRIWLTDGGLETAMIFLEGLDLPQFASFPLLKTQTGRAALTRYFDGFLRTASRFGTGFVLDTATWRASHGWGEPMGLSGAEIDAANREAVAFARGVMAEYPGLDVVVNGVVGPHGDAYAPDRQLTVAEALEYHARQVDVLAKAGADMISAVTIGTPAEAIGIAKAAEWADRPVVLSFTVETDGNLLSGMSLAAAIAEVDGATRGYAAWYGINCAHPDHFRARLSGDWVSRIGMVRANASRKSHAELDESTALDAGDPDELAQDYAALAQVLPALRVVGGCCGTDLRHISAIGGNLCHPTERTLLH